jgi:hypothetical protein
MSVLAKVHWMRGAWVLPALTLAALAVGPASAADRVVIAEEFSNNG